MRFNGSFGILKEMLYHCSSSNGRLSSSMNSTRWVYRSAIIGGDSLWSHSFSMGKDQSMSSNSRDSREGAGRTLWSLWSFPHSLCRIGEMV